MKFNFQTIHWREKKRDTVLSSQSNCVVLVIRLSKQRSFTTDCTYMLINKISYYKYGFYCVVGSTGYEFGSAYVLIIYFLNCIKLKKCLETSSHSVSFLFLCCYIIW